MTWKDYIKSIQRIIVAGGPRNVAEQRDLLTMLASVTKLMNADDADDSKVEAELKQARAEASKLKQESEKWHTLAVGLSEDVANLEVELADLKASHAACATPEPALEEIEDKPKRRSRRKKKSESFSEE